MKNLQKIADVLIKNNILIFYGRVKDRILELDRKDTEYSLVNIRNGIMRAQSSITGAWERILGVLRFSGESKDGFIHLLAHTVRPKSREGSDRAVDIVYAASERARWIFCI